MEETYEHVNQSIREAAFEAFGDEKKNNQLSETTVAAIKEKERLFENLLSTKSEEHYLKYRDIKGNKKSD